MKARAPPQSLVLRTLVRCRRLRTTFRSASSYFSPPCGIGEATIFLGPEVDKLLPIIFSSMVGSPDKQNKIIFVSLIAVERWTGV